MTLGSTPSRSELGSFVRSALNVRGGDPVNVGWVAVGLGFSGAVNAIHSHNGSLYAGGAFTNNSDFSTQLKLVARWNTSEWVPVGSGIDILFYVKSLATYNDELYAGGLFSLPSPKKGVVVFDGSSWVAVGSGFFDGQVNSLEVFGLQLYAGGSFTKNGNSTAMAKVAKFNGSDWEAVGTGFNSTVNELHTFDNELYACGSFTENGNGDAMTRVAKFNGSDWEAVGSGFNASVNRLFTFDDELYAGGTFTTNGSAVSMKYISKLGASDWESVYSNDLTSSVSAIGSFEDELFVNTGSGLGYVAKSSGGSWATAGSGFDAAVGVFGTHISSVYAGGGFVANGDGDDMFRIAKWTGDPP